MYIGDDIMSCGFVSVSTAHLPFLKEAGRGQGTALAPSNSAEHSAQKRAPAARAGAMAWKLSKDRRLAESGMRDAA
jgi:hypothetical protein